MCVPADVLPIWSFFLPHVTQLLTTLNGYLVENCILGHVAHGWMLKLEFVIIAVTTLRYHISYLDVDRRQKVE